jgi:hypothetical protein
LALRNWLPAVLNYADPWVSSEDIDKGAVWNAELRAALDAACFGIICLTGENLEKPWIYFEAGAMSRTLEKRVAPLLVGISKDEVKDPLAQFQLTAFEKEDVRKLVHSVNRASSPPIDDDRVNRQFDACWPGLVEAVGKVRSTTVETPKQPAKAVAVAPPPLPPELVEIIKILAHHPDEEPSAADMAAGIGVNETRARHYFDRLKELGYVYDSLVVGEAPRFQLRDKGRAYAVEHGLV